MFQPALAKCLCGQRFPWATGMPAKTARERFGDPEEWT
jgi:hypothetical protein